MASSTTRRRAPRRGKKTPPAAWLQFWPLLLALIATPFAVRAASVMALTGPSALRVLYPYVVLVEEQASHFSSEQADTLSQWILYGQFPLYGLVWILFSRLVGRSAGPLAALLVHGAGLAAAIFFAVS